MATTLLDTQQQHAQQVHATIVPFAPMAQRSGTLRTSVPERAQIPESAMVVAYDGWTGMQMIYLRPKKKKRKPHLKKEDTDESSNVDDGGWMREREVKLATLQAKPQEESKAETSGGAQEEEEPMGQLRMRKWSDEDTLVEKKKKKKKKFYCTNSHFQLLRKPQ
jgi:hypothetical protein